MNAKGDLNRSVRATKRAIQAAVVELLQSKSIDAITVRELTEKADVNRSTFYLHYKDVYDLLEQMEEKALEELKTFLTSEALSEFTKDGYPMLNRIFSHLADNQERFIVLFGPNGRKDARQRAIEFHVEHLVRLLCQECGFERTQELKMGARFVFEGGLATLIHQFDQGKPLNNDELVRFYAHITTAILKAYTEEKKERL